MVTEANGDRMPHRFSEAGSEGENLAGSHLAEGGGDLRKEGRTAQHAERRGLPHINDGHDLLRTGRIIAQQLLHHLIHLITSLSVRHAWHPPGHPVAPYAVPSLT